MRLYPVGYRGINLSEADKLSLSAHSKTAPRRRQEVFSYVFFLYR